MGRSLRGVVDVVSPTGCGFQYDNLDLDMPKTEFKKASFSYSGTQLWNSLPIRIRNSSKTEFLQYLMENTMAG